MLTDARIDEIKRLRAGITPPPWRRDVTKLGRSLVSVPHDKRPYTITGVFNAIEDADANAAFIAASPTIVDDLLAEREELLVVREAAARYIHECDYLVTTDMHDNYTDRDRSRQRQWQAERDMRAALAGKEGQL